MDQWPKYKNSNHKIPGRKFEVNHHEFGFGNGFVSGMSPKHQQKKKVDKLYFIKIKSQCTSKDSYRMEENIFTTYI